MKINFIQSQLVEKVAIATACVSKGGPIASTEGLLIKAEDGQVVLISYDMEKGIRVEIDADIIEPGSCIINAANFTAIIKMMPAGLMTLEVDPETWRARVYAGKAEFEINALSPTAYPTLPNIQNRQGFNMKQGELKDMVTQTLFAVAQNDARSAFNGAYVKIVGNRITMVGCDSFRLAIREKVCGLEENTFGDTLDTQFIIPGRTLAEVIRLLDEPDKTVNLNLAIKQVIFRFEERGIIFWTRLIDAQYIDYERTIPKNLTINAEIDSALFEGALGRAAVISDEAAGKHKAAARCRFAGNTLEINSLSASGKVRDEIPIALSGGELEIAFNCRYLLDAIRACGCEKLKLSLASAYISMIIEPTVTDENDKFTYLVLPIRMQK